ncbi:MAG: RidA family protein [Planctomycetota bacterium]|nr:MAG: RidA family protein [Planctomycetota bacterium]
MGTTERTRPVLARAEGFSAGEREELRALGLLTESGDIVGRDLPPPQVPRTKISAPDILNEAYDYPLPSSFTRGLSVNIRAGQRILWISGTASIDDQGRTIHVGDFRAQTWRTFRNITRLLEAEGATWRDIVRTTCYLRDIERDYDEFNKVRTLFYRCLGLDPLPASTGIQARLCRSDLLIEIEAFAVLADGEA